MGLVKTNRIYHYHVQLSFRGEGSTVRIGRKTSGYVGTHAYQDTIIFFPKKCNLVLSRTKKYDDGSILSNSNNSINTQIIKALLCYYAITKDFPIIDKIIIVRKRTGAPDYIYTETDSFIQPLGGKVQRSLLCNSSVVDGLLEDNYRGQVLRIAMSYWLKGIASEDAYYKFEHLWRAFNGLFMYQGGHPKEFENMRAMRGFILSNKASFSKCIAITNAYTENQFSSYRWSRMILNDYDTESKTNALVDFVYRYHDGRIMKMLQEKLACRKEYLTNCGKLADVNRYIASQLAVRCDAELVTLVAIKYAYFVRNKMFHGEVIDGSFRVRKNNMDAELCRLNELLEMLIMEIMENYHLLRV